MKRKTISAIILSMLVTSMLVLAFRIQQAKAGTITVPDDYPTIQEAVNHANAGDAIFVRSGTYSGPIVIDKSLSLEGENKETTIIDGGTNEPSGSIVLVAADNVKISGFAIQHCRGGGNAVYLDNYVNMNFSYNIIKGCNEGVRILHSSGNVVSYNIVQDCYYNTGVGFDWSHNNIVHRNTIIHNHYGLSGGYDNHNNVYSENTIINNDVGFGTNMYDDKFFHNNFVNNGVQVIATGVNQFDDGYPSGGNYWSDYTGQDSDGDGIGDTSYIINENNRDRYPFMQQNGWVETMTFKSSTSDGHVTRFDASYTAARDADLGIHIGDSDNFLVIGQYSEPSHSEYHIYRAFLFFDTSPLPLDANIISATLSFWGQQDNSEIDFYIIVQSGQPSYPHDPLRLEDYNRLHYSGNGGSFFTGDIDPNTWNERYWNISLNNDGIGMVNKEGQTKLCLRSSRDIDGIAPPHPPDALESVQIRSANYHPILYKPLLTITYEAHVPPNIESISSAPAIPNYDEDVVVSATITDSIGVDEALLSYTYDFTWHNASMNQFGALLNSTISAQPYGTLVQYKIYANDTDDNWAVSELYSYTVDDFIAPEVTSSRIPVYPLPGQKVKAYADVTEPVDASGIKNPVFFSYRVNSGSWWNTTMSFNGALGLYETTIPACEKYDVVEYFVKAEDNAGNINTTAMHHYEVLRCDVNHNGVVDVYDIYLIGEAWESRLGEVGYNSEADINEDGIVNSQDLTPVSTQYGKDP